MCWHSPAISDLERLLEKIIGMIQAESGVAILPLRAGRGWLGAERTAFHSSRMEKTDSVSASECTSQSSGRQAPGFELETMPKAFINPLPSEANAAVCVFEE